MAGQAGGQAPGQAGGQAPGQAADGAQGRVAGVEAAVAELTALDTLPVGEHVARYDALHGTLSEALAAIDGL